MSARAVGSAWRQAVNGRVHVALGSRAVLQDASGALRVCRKHKVFFNFPQGSLGKPAAAVSFRVTQCHSPLNNRKLLIG